MAIYFLLDIDFGTNVAEAEAARRLIRACPPLRAGARQASLHDSLVGEGSRVTVVPRGVGYALPVELAERTRRLDLTAEELSALGWSLYDLLRQCTGYRLAAVGWELGEIWFENGELSPEYADDLAAGGLPGLVVSDDVHRALPRSTGFEPFEPGYQWMPYRGETST
ncbi:hypothetical protein VA596_49060 [Amycolatopsis sp., V23-08]|uniref:Uncharacterized protein n=1 Tax=Amycolatopsis heterodermiae TaxID=3110235 RepID=A0ABU5RML9_9PSEU|nr:hypothetical protein [Amycolatopsis sp., V23-08]MEA5367557.1 hypothetical protein [Amycolatopsis sp., V23-08]